MNRFALIIPFSLILLAGCGEECETVSVPVCEAFEDGSHPVMTGNWKGTYTADRYWMGTNDVEMDWNFATYDLRMERGSYFWRKPLYRDSDMTNLETLAQDQSNFKAQYRPREWWYLSGGFSVEGSDLVYQGHIRTHGHSVGQFLMRKKRECVKESVRHKDVCSKTFEPLAVYPLLSTEPSEKEKPVSVGPTLVDVTVSPNPVTTGGTVHVSAAALPPASSQWSAWIAPASDTTHPLASWSLKGTNFDKYAAAPTVPGKTYFWVKVSNKDGADIQEIPFDVILP